MIKSSLRRKGTASLAAAVSLVFANHALAQNTPPVVWDGTTGAYTTGTNWNPDVTPTNAANEFLSIDNGGTAQVGTGDAAEGAFLMLGLRPGDTGHLEVSDGTLTVGELRVGGRETINSNLADWTTPGTFDPNGGGTGTVLQTGGAVNVNFVGTGEQPVQSLYIGDSGLASGNTANGSYTIKNNATLLSGINDTDGITVGTGAGAQGTFLQEDTSTVTSTGFLTIARRGATGSYTISGGTLNIGSGTTAPTMRLRIGDGLNAAGDGGVAGTNGTFTQSNGAVIVKASTDIGLRGGTGSYTMDGGTLSLGGQFNVGTTASSTVPGTTNSVGTFTFNGGTITTTAANNVFIGFNGASATYSATPTSTGTFTMTGGTMTLNNTLFIVGSGSGATGTAEISGGTLQGNTGINVEYDIGRNGGSGSLTLSGTGVLKGNTFLVGAGASIGNNGTLTVDGGTLTANNIGLSPSPLAGATPVRTLNINGGSVTTGTFNQLGAIDPVGVTRTATVTGGTFTVTGATTGGKNVTYNLSGGTTKFQGAFNLDNSTLNISSTADVTFANVNSTANHGGTTTISGGTVTGTGIWRISNTAPPVPGSLTISGGNVTIASLITGGTASALNISGGTISIPLLTLSSGTTFKTDNAISLNSAVTFLNATVNVNSGSLQLTGPINTTAANTLTKTGPGALTIAGAQTYAGGSAMINNVGTLNVNTIAAASMDSASPANLSVNVNAATNFGSNQRLDALTVGATGTATVTDGVDKTLKVNTLTVDPGGLLAMNDNDFIVDYTGTSPEVALRDHVKSIYLGGTTGISYTPGAGDVALAVAERTEWGFSEFNGVALDTTAVVGKYTYFGDANLDGKVTSDDYVAVDVGLGMGDSWVQGDFNFSGTVTSDDYVAIDVNLGKGSPTPLAFAELKAEMVALHTAMFGDEYAQMLARVEAEGFIALVPEPGSLSLVGLAAAGLLGRRRRSR